MKRRSFLLLGLLAPAGARGAPAFAPVTRNTPLRFPADHGAHPDFRTEWWYLTGWLRSEVGQALGVQVTFFRTRTELQPDNPSAFAPTQLLFAHAALADPRQGVLLHDQRAARAGFGLAEARTGTTDVRIDDWSLRLQGGERYVARAVSRQFELELAVVATQPILLQGEQGFSQKGPDPLQASYYYSRPQLAVSGSIRLAGATRVVSGVAWLDHEWSSQLLPAAAVGWDWTGVNLADGGALMAFRIRDGQGATLWGAATQRSPAGAVRRFGPETVTFTPLRRWRSPRTGIEYPVAMRVTVDGSALALQPLMDDQELDARASTGTIYWEGAVRAQAEGETLGTGYLELTGYGEPLRL